MITNVLNLRCSIENHSIIRSRVRTVNSIKARVQHNTENLSFFSFGEDFLTLSAILFSLIRLFFCRRILFVFAGALLHTQSTIRVVQQDGWLGRQRSRKGK